MVNTKNYQDAMNTLETLSPEVIFDPLSSYNQNRTIESRKAFVDYFTKHYEMNLESKAITHSTEHITYYLYHNSLNQDVRILKVESGCFRTHQEFVTVEDIQKDIERIQKMMASYKNQDDMSYFEKQIQPLQIVIDTYYQLKNKDTLTIKTSLKLK